MTISPQSVPVGNPEGVDTESAATAVTPYVRNALWSRIKRASTAIFAPGESADQDVPFEWFSTKEVSEYFDASHESQSFEAMDDKTYREIDGASYARLLLNNRSIFARQFFEQRFRVGSKPDEAQAFAEIVMQLSTNDNALDAIGMSVKPLLKAQQEVASVLFRPGVIAMPPDFARLRHLDILGVGLCCILAVWPSVTTLSILLAYLVFSLCVQVRCYRFLKVWTNKRSALQKLVATASNIQARCQSLPKGLLPSILMDQPRLEKVVVALEAGMLARSSITAEYANLLFLYEYARATNESQRVAAQLDELKEIYEAVSRLELQFAISQRVRNGLLICRSTETHDGLVSFQGLLHPLISLPLALNFNTRGRSLFISGQNGIGKSTLLRAVGLSVTVFRAFGYAHAQAATLPRVAVWSSMQVDDSVEEGRSLYMSELARASRLLEVGGQAQPVLFLVDELFRGTNYLESVAACASVLHSLSQQNLVFDTSHNVVLATLLRERFDAVKLMKSEPSGLELVPGVLITTNGVELMNAYQFESGVIARANAIASWYADYITHPENISSSLVGDQEASLSTEPR